MKASARVAFFLIFFITLYTGINFYFFRKVQLAWPGQLAVLIAAGFFCVAMVAAPILVRTFERSGEIGPARVCAWLGHTWMAMVFWFLCAGLLVDAWNLGLRVAARWRPTAGEWAASPRMLLLAAAATVLLLSAWGFYEAWNVRLRTVLFRTARMAPGTKPMRIAAISDVHLSLTIDEPFTRRVAELIERAQPDLVVCLGDMADADFERANGAARRLAAVKAPMGKYAVLGNHEFYAGLRNGLALLEAAGFTVLRGESVRLPNGTLLAGVDDPTARLRGLPPADERTALPPAADRPLTILLKHRPDVARGAERRFDLQLSGHSHGGQIFPFSLIVKLFHPLGPGVVELNDGAMLYVSRGTGTWGPRIRFTQPPEVTLVIVEPMEATP
jgi:predicted MPP superfamily phosphohydrolase